MNNQETKTKLENNKPVEDKQLYNRKVLLLSSVLVALVTGIAVVLASSLLTTYENLETYNVPASYIHVSHFTQKGEESGQIYLVSTKPDTARNLYEHLVLKHKYKDLLGSLESRNELEIEDSKKRKGKIIQTTNVTEMVTAAYIAANKEAGNEKSYTREYRISSMPAYLEDDPTYQVEIDDKLISVNGKLLDEEVNLDYLTATEKVWDLEVERLGERTKIKSPLYGAYIKATYTVKDERELQKTVRLFDSHFDGDSAGAPLALQLYIDYTQDISSGRNIAATGAITPEGVIGPVGGVTAKTILAIQNKADVLFVPYDAQVAQNYSDAIEVKRQLGSDIQIEPVHSLKEIIDYLKESK